MAFLRRSEAVAPGLRSRRPDALAFKPVEEDFQCRAGHCADAGDHLVPSFQATTLYPRSGDQACRNQDSEEDHPLLGTQTLPLRPESHPRGDLGPGPRCYLFLGGDPHRPPNSFPCGRPSKSSRGIQVCSGQGRDLLRPPSMFDARVTEEAVIGLGLEPPGSHLFGQAMGRGEDKGVLVRKSSIARVVLPLPPPPERSESRCRDRGWTWRGAALGGRSIFVAL